MKRKHHSLVCLVLSVISLMFTVCYAIYSADRLTGSIRLPAPVPLPELKTPDAAAMAYVDYMGHLLSDLSLADKSGRTDKSDIMSDKKSVDLVLFGRKRTFAVQNNENNTGNHRQQEAAGDFSYYLSLAFSSDTHCFCVIDGKLYSGKAILPDGGKIEKIEDNRVLISKNNKKVWIHI